VEEAVGEGVVGDEDIEAAVAVEVGEGDGHAFAAGGGADAGGLGDIFEGAVAVIAEEAVGGGCGGFGMAVDPAGAAGIESAGGAGEEEHEETVAVVVEGGEAAGHGFGQEFLG